MNLKERISLQALSLKITRNFFENENFQEVITPPMVQNPGMEAHIHPFFVSSAKSRAQTLYYLHTSPEFHMKELLSSGMEKIYTLSYCFRDEPHSLIHRSQFLMLEWYRSHSLYHQIMADCEKLILKFIFEFQESNIPLLKMYQSHQLPFTKMTIQEIFLKYLKIDILKYLDSDKIFDLIKNQFPDIPMPRNEKLPWEDYFFLIFLNKIEPHLIQYPALILYEFPAPLAALSKIKKDQTNVCERFEIYLRGIEIGNCFQELTCLKEQSKRFADQNDLKQNLYHYSLPNPVHFLNVLKKGLPESAGIAIGFERIIMALTGSENSFFSEHKN